MRPYLVFMCPRCGSIRYSREGQKTASCLECGYKIFLVYRIRILMRTKSREEAIYAVKAYKMRIKNRSKI